MKKNLRLIKTIRIYSQDIGMEFVIKKNCANTHDEKWGKRNTERNRTTKIKKAFKRLEKRETKKIYWKQTPSNKRK